jgi:hypothetical protein
MFRRAWYAGAIVAAAVAVGILVTARFGELPLVGTIGDSGQANSARAAAAPALSQQGALERARSFAEDHLLQTAAIYKVGGQSFPEVDGRPIVLSDFALAGSAFFPDASEVKLPGSDSVLRTNGRSNVWVFLFRAAGVPMPEWNITDAVVEVEIVFEDDTGRLASRGMRILNPHAAKPPPGK